MGKYLNTDFLIDSMNSELKQVILVRTDLKMGKGKIAAQVAHASVEATLKTLKRKKNLFYAWHRLGMKKSVLKVKSEEELFSFREKAKREKIVTALITDAGRTQIEEGTITCLAIGPDKEEVIDEITGDLKLL